jgi:hypothetical protein
MKAIVESFIKIRNANMTAEEKSKMDFAKIMQHPGDFIDPSEPSILFLGTVSMKPTQYRSASAIMVFIRGHGILMDCAEGSFGQLLDHFMSNMEAVN